MACATHTVRMVIKVVGIRRSLYIHEIASLRSAGQGYEPRVNHSRKKLLVLKLCLMLKSAVPSSGAFFMHNVEVVLDPKIRIPWYCLLTLESCTAKGTGLVSPPEYPSWDLRFLKAQRNLAGFLAK